MTGKEAINSLAKQRKRQHEDSALVFPKITNLTGDMILQHQLDDTYTRTSYSIHYDPKNFLDKPTSPLVRKGPPPQKDILTWDEQEQGNNGSGDTGKKGSKDIQYNRFETEYASGYRHVPLSPSKKKEYTSGYSHISYSPIQRQRLLNREEITKMKLPEMIGDAESQEQSTPLPSPVMMNRQMNADCYADLNKFLGLDIFRDRDVLAELLDSADKRYLIKLLNSLSPETLLGLRRWLLAREEENEEGDLTRCPPISTPTSPPSTPTKDQENASNEPTMPASLDKRVSPSFNKIFEKSPSEEREVIRKLLNAGDHKYLEKFLSCVVQPEALQGARSWLISHDGKDREVAIRFLGDIRKPLSRQLKDAIKEEKLRENIENVLKSGQSQLLIKRTREKRRPPHGSNCSCAVCDTDHSNKILKALYKHGTTAIIDEMRKALEFVPRPKKTITRKQHARKYQVARLGGDKLGQRTVNHTSYLANKGALFMQPHRTIPPYFVIHPELP